jgi:uncharacterized protein YjdB
MRKRKFLYQTTIVSMLTMLLTLVTSVFGLVPLAMADNGPPDSVANRSEIAADGRYTDADGVSLSLRGKPNKPNTPVTGVRLNRTELSVKIGATAKLRAIVEPSKASNKKVVWTSSDTGVATVSDKGKIKGKKSGTATVTVTTVDGGKTATALVRVKSEVPEKAAIELDVPESVGAGEYVTVTTTATNLKHTGLEQVHYELAKRSGDGDIYWSASDRNGEPTDIKNNGVYGEGGFSIPGNSTDQVDWTVKFSEVGAYELAIRVVDAEGRILAEDMQTVNVTPMIVNLGPQVLMGNTSYRGAIGEESGRAVGYTVIPSSPNSRFVVIDIESERAVKHFDLNIAEGTWSIWPAKSGKVYIGTYTKSKLFEYDPALNEVTDLHGPMESASGAIIYQMAEDRDGMIYFGVYPESRVFRFDPTTRQFQDLGRMANDQFYSRSMVYGETEHSLYVGVGGNRASLVRYDLSSGAKTELMPDSIRDKYRLTYDLNLIDGKLFAKMDPNNGLVVIDTHTGVTKDFGDQAIHSSGVSPKSPYADEVYLTYGGVMKTYNLNTDTITDTISATGKMDLKANVVGWGLVEMSGESDSGYTLVGFAGTSGGFFKYNLQSKKWRLANIELPKVPLKLNTLGASTDGNIFSAGFLPGGMGIFNPATGTDIVGLPMNQVEGMTALGNKMYFGVYPSAILFEYDTTKAWQLGGTVVQKFELKTDYKQDRAYAMLGVPEVNKVFIGTVPDYAVSGGALTVYDPTKGSNSYQVYRNIVQDQSVVSLAYKDGKIYGGTSYVGGMGQTWPYADGRLFAFDIATGQKEYETVPVPGKGAVNALVAGPDGNIWGFAQGTFFVYDPVLRQVVHSEEAFPESTGGWRDPQMQVSLRDGHVYGTIAGNYFFRIDKQTREITVLANGASLLAQDRYGNFYFKLKENESNLYRYTFEDNTVAASKVSLEAHTVELYLDETVKLNAVVSPSYASPNVVWSSTDHTVAKVSSEGVIIPVSAGSATITVSNPNGKSSDSVLVTVKERTYSTYGIELESSSDVYEQSGAAFDISLRTLKTGLSPLEHAYYVLEKTQGEGEAVFTYTWADGEEHSIVDAGEYGKPGLVIPAILYDTMNWSVAFSQAGQYEVKIRLVDPGAGVLAEKVHSFTVKPKPANSLYKFRSSVTSVTYDVYSSMPVLLKTDILSANGYNGAKITVENKSLPVGNAWFELNDQGRSYSFQNSGEIRSDGFVAGADYSETIPWSIKLDRPGAYTLRWKLLSSDNAVIAQYDQIVVAVMHNAVPLDNTGFETPQQADGSIAEWSVSTLAPDQSVSVSGVVRYNGAHSLRFSDGSSTATLSIQTARKPVVPGKTYQGSILLYNSGPASYTQFYLQFFNASGARLTPVQWKSFDVPIGQWTPLLLSAVAPENAVTANILVYSPGGTVLAGYLDEATLTYGD